MGIPDPSWYQPYQSLFAAGLRVAWHGDWRASDFATDTDDMLRSNFGALLNSLTTRVQHNADGTACAPPPWYAAEAVTTLQALRMMTINAAYALGTDSVVGSLEPGKFADLVIVNQDPLLLSPSALTGVRVVSTVVGEAPVSCAPEAASLCP